MMDILPKQRILQRGATLLLLGILLFSIGGASGVQPALAMSPSQSGIVCTIGTSFTLTAKSGYITIPDGNTIFMWSYALGNGAFQLPGPILCVNQGDTVTITLNNTLPERVSIFFPGLDNVTVGGSPAQPEFNGPGGALSSMTNSAASGGSVTYSFVANQPGTYLYESGTDMGKQVQMGLYGSLVVRPNSGNCPAVSGTGCAYNASTRFKSTTEYVMLLSEIDPDLHQAVERSQPYNVVAYHPRYWLINGRAFPDTIAPNNAAWLPSQPYSAFVHIHPKDNSNPWPALVRYLNVGSLNHPFHPHGNHGRLIAREARLLTGPLGQDLSTENFLVMIGSGQTWDVTYNYSVDPAAGGDSNSEGWNPSTNPIPVIVPQLQNLIFKDNATWYSGSPYIGYQDDLPAGVTSYNECGEYYMVWHSHALNEFANFDAGFGGMGTLERIDPPLPNGCP
jgi:FtsP/CotA-like multicopper oxidase with cupredoxin domain